MSLQTIGDLAQSFALRRQSVELTRQMDRLTLELSSGEAADLSRHLSGNMFQISDIDRELALLGTHRDTALLASTDARLMQTSLSRVQDESAAVAATALTVGATEGQAPVATLAVQARDALGAIIGALNGDAGGRALFSGTRTDRAPLASAENLLSGLRAAVAGATSVAEITQRLDGFFDDPAGGFAPRSIAGGTPDCSPMILGRASLSRLISRRMTRGCAARSGRWRWRRCWTIRRCPSRRKPDAIWRGMLERGS